jgi:hypothetical protein
MKKYIIFAASLMVWLLFLQVMAAKSQELVGRRCPMCGQNWDGSYGQNTSIPSPLPKPKKQEWIDKLRQVLAIEKQSEAQYAAERKRFEIHYMSVIPEEDNHVRWLTELLTAYGVSIDVDVPPIQESRSLVEAYEHGMKTEGDLVSKYEWLLKNAEDKTAQQALDTILLQTRLHVTVFSHALIVQKLKGE